MFATELSSLVTAFSCESEPISSEVDEDYCDLAQLLRISGSTKNFSLIRRMCVLLLVFLCVLLLSCVYCCSCLVCIVVVLRVFSVLCVYCCFLL